MNSLNLLSSRVMGRKAAVASRRSQATPVPSQATPVPSQAKAREAGGTDQTADADADADADAGEAGTEADYLRRGRLYNDDKASPLSAEAEELEPGQPTPLLRIERVDGEVGDDNDDDDNDEYDDEKKALLDIKPKLQPVARPARWRVLLRRLANALAALLTALGAPVIYLARWLRDDDGRLALGRGQPRQPQAQHSPNSPNSSHGRHSRRNTAATTAAAAAASHRAALRQLNPSYSTESLTSDSDDSECRVSMGSAVGSAAAATRTSKRGSISREPRRSSIRIKEQSEASLQQQRRRRRQQQQQQHHRHSPLSDAPPLTVHNIKSPISAPSSLKVTRYPHQPRPPRPLTPRRQPSYSTLLRRTSDPHRGSAPNTTLPGQYDQQKTLVLDLDETLIHSLARGGRMSSGHMVEVKLNAPVAVAVSPPPPLPPPQSPNGSQTATASASAPSTFAPSTFAPSPFAPSPPPAPATSQVIGPQHPILYYVHKRPHCDEFLKKVCKWYKLVIFTASVQEYADPVIDWLEQERKYFAGRYYRQHCTFRNGAYIKDLSAIEPDLSKVVILDNSPVSYVFHPDNAIPIEGWISDPSDNDLLHLIPMLEALQYVPDVRALLALRRGETADNAVTTGAGAGAGQTTPPTTPPTPTSTST